jgi:hypothetical protein
VCWDYGDIGGNGRISTSYAGKIGKWTHVALVSGGAGGNFKAIYLDGVLAASADVSDGPSHTITGLDIGRSPESLGGDFHLGRIDDFRIYNRILSGPEIATLAAKGELKRGDSSPSRGGR